MIEKTANVVNRLGLHARAAAKLVHLTSRFVSHVTISRDGEKVDGKSILGILMLAAPQGSAVELQVDGNDEDEAAKAILDLFARRFEEDG